MNNEQLNEFHACKTWPAYFIDSFCYLLDPDKGRIPFKLYEYQKDVLGKFVLNRFNIILKARQLGISWLVAAYALWMAMFHPGKSVLFISIKDQTASELLDKVKYILDQLPDWMKPETYKRNETLLWFGCEQPDGKVTGLNSIVKSIPTSKEAGRSKSLSLLIMDEAAFIRWADDIYTSAFPTLANGGNAIFLSSANGMGNLFHRLWCEAKAGVNNFETTFLPWSVYPGRDAEWYAQKKKDMRLWQLNQEFPSTPEESFVQSGRPVFDIQYLKLNASVTEPISDIGGLKVFQNPQEGHRYAIGADVAEGLASGDYSAAVVLDVDSGEQVAELHGHWPPEIFADKLDKLAREYEGILGVESNNHGHSVLLKLRELNTPGLYYRKVGGDIV